MPFVAFRYANVYGPRQDPHGEAGVVAIFSGKMLRGEPITVNGDGTQTRDYVFVGDVCAPERAGAPARGHRTGQHRHRGRDRREPARRHAPRGLRRAASEMRHGPAKPGEQRRSVVDVRRAADVFGWRPEVSLRDGLARTVEFFRARAAG